MIYYGQDKFGLLWRASECGPFLVSIVAWTFPGHDACIRSYRCYGKGVPYTRKKKGTIWG